MKPVLALFGGEGDWLPQGSGMAGRVDGIICGLLVTAGVVVLVLTVVTTYILVRYRKASRAPRGPVRIPTWKIEATWTVVTLAVFLYFFTRGAAAYIEMRQAPAGAGVVNIVARQWMWDMRYEDGRREFNVLHLKVGTPVRLVLASEDVIHSFFVPAFRLKQDAVPGRLVSTWVTPTRPGTYTIFCAQYCGTAHAEMTGTVVVMGATEFDAWRRGSHPPGAGTAVIRGRAVYMRFGCARCHEDRAADRAPALAGLYGNRIRLADGATVLGDEQYLHDAILLAPKYQVAGYQGGMPTYAGIMSEREALDLVSYIESLTPTGTAAPSKP